MNKHLHITLFILSVLLLSGCIKESFKGALPSYLETIYIPMFESKAHRTLPEDTELLTQEVIDKFLDDNTLKIVNKEKDADLILIGSISSITEGPDQIGENETVTQNKLTVKVAIECTNTHTNKPLWKQTVSQDGFYGIGGGDSDRLAAYEELIVTLAEEILNKTIAAW